jgi:hypothetical protein
MWFSLSYCFADAVLGAAALEKLQSKGRLSLRRPTWLSTPKSGTSRTLVLFKIQQGATIKRSPSLTR